MDIIKRIEDYSLEEIMSLRFAAYAKEIIQDRAIPDVRDGLKPVQRRILRSSSSGNSRNPSGAALLSWKRKRMWAAGSPRKRR